MDDLFKVQLKKSKLYTERLNEDHIVLDKENKFVFSERVIKKDVMHVFR